MGRQVAGREFLRAYLDHGSWDELVADGKKEHLLTMRTCQDCADLCSVTARLLARQGPLSDTSVLACAQACKRCGDECAKHTHDPLMKQCAEECRKCEKACREMVQHAGGAGPSK